MKCICIFSSLLVSLATVGTAQSRPNIILIMTDDQGYGDLGITGKPRARAAAPRRPRVRRCDDEKFYASPVCSRARAQLMTGRYAYRTRVVDTFKGRSRMEPAEFTAADATCAIELRRPKPTAAGSIALRAGAVTPTTEVREPADHVIGKRPGSSTRANRSRAKPISSPMLSGPTPGNSRGRT